MGRGQGLGVGQGRKTYSWCFMSLGVVFLLICLFQKFHFWCNFFLFSENTEVHTLLVLQNTQGYKFFT